MRNSHLALAFVVAAACTEQGRAPASSGSGPSPSPSPSPSLSPSTSLSPSPSPATTAAAPAAPQVIKLEGFSTPESILWDEQADVYLVSNINGSPFAKDGNGFISRVSPPPDARILELKWIEGGRNGVTLNAPKGMAILGDVLYVTDIDTVRLFDRRTGAPRGAIAIPGAMFLNDLVAGAGVVYLSDTGVDAHFQPTPGQAIWELRDGKPNQLAKGAELGAPNGLALDGDALWVVTFGSGELYRLGAGGAREAVEKLPKGALDGLIVTGDRFIVSSWEGQTLFLGRPGGGWTRAVQGLPSPADLGLDARRHLLLVPIFQQDRIELHEAPRP